jgi:hypothetical protein
VTLPTTVDFNAIRDILLALLTERAEALNLFMQTTTPYVLGCHRKKLLFMLFLETTIVFAFLYEARRARHLACTYLPLKVIALTVPVS